MSPTLTSTIQPRISGTQPIKILRLSDLPKRDNDAEAARMRTRLLAGEGKYNSRAVNGKRVIGPRRPKIARCFDGWAVLHDGTVAAKLGESHSISKRELARIETAYDLYDMDDREDMHIPGLLCALAYARQQTGIVPNWTSDSYPPVEFQRIEQDLLGGRL